MNAVDLANCDREPIHIPGSIQPHGMMLVAERNTLTVCYGAGDIEARLGVPDWQGAALGRLLGDSVAGRIAHASNSGGMVGFAGQTTGRAGETYDVSAHLSGEWLVVEVEAGSPEQRPASELLGQLSNAGAGFERASGLISLCKRAACEFRLLTGFDRVMVYRFLEDAAGVVLAEDKAEELPSFLNHHFPASDIPKQARALYVRNLVRVIPDVRYAPAPLRPAWAETADLDMSDSALRSVSPVHLQYMQNMGIVASASISVVKDGVLWGLIACHHRSPRQLGYDLRVACATLAGGFARQVKAKEEAELYRERIRLRSFEDGFIGAISSEPSLVEGMAAHMPDLSRMLVSDGVAAIQGDRVDLHGVTPREEDIRRLADWVLNTSPLEPLCSDELARRFPAASAYSDKASGLLAVVVAATDPFVLMWFRAEKIQVVEWAGNPHKAVEIEPSRGLTPRASFDAWRETVRGRSAPWSLAELEASTRLKHALLELRRRQQLVQLNRSLTETLQTKEVLLEQKEFLLREVDHRVQNSLQLVSAFLRLQSRTLANPEAAGPLDEAQRRLDAVALVHRRLYRGDQINRIDMARYLEELVQDVLASMDPVGAIR